MARRIVSSQRPNPGGRTSKPRLAGAGHNSTMHVEQVPLGQLKLSDVVIRTFKPLERRQAIRILKSTGARMALVASADGTVLVGEVVYEAALAFGWDALPVIRAADLTPAEAQALRVAYQRLGELGTTDKKRLGELVIQFRMEIPGFDEENLGYEVGELDFAINLAGGLSQGAPEEPLPEADPAALPVSRIGDIWFLDKHRVGCMDATQSSSVTALMAGAVADAMMTDPPYGPRVNGFIARTGRHREFVMGSTDVSEDGLRELFAGFVAAGLPHLRDGALLYIFIDWRSFPLLLEAVTPLLGKLVNLAVWAKDRSGLGSFMRSRHELIPIFKKGQGRFRNNVMLGVNGRNRSNLWNYPSAKTASKGSDEGNMLDLHPTPKSVPMIADAILDCTKSGDIILDLFLGSGTTLIAAEKVGRVAYGLDLDPLYVDVAVRRWQRWTGRQAVHAESGRSFDDIEAERTSNQ